MSDQEGRMRSKHFFFKHVVKSNLTGEQLRVLMCMLTTETDGVIGTGIAKL